jgi:hypothetical protein
MSDPIQENTSRETMRDLLEISRILGALPGTEFSGDPKYWRDKIPNPRQSKIDNLQCRAEDIQTMINTTIKDQVEAYLRYLNSTGELYDLPDPEGVLDSIMHDWSTEQEYIGEKLPDSFYLCNRTGKFVQQWEIDAWDGELDRIVPREINLDEAVILTDEGIARFGECGQYGMGDLDTIPSVDPDELMPNNEKGRKYTPNQSAVQRRKKVKWVDAIKQDLKKRQDEVLESIVEPERGPFDTVPGSYADELWGALESDRLIDTIKTAAVLSDIRHDETTQGGGENGTVHGAKGNLCVGGGSIKPAVMCKGSEDKGVGLAKQNQVRAACNLILMLADTVTG